MDPPQARARSWRFVCIITRQVRAVVSALRFSCHENIIYAKYTFVVHTNWPKSNERSGAHAFSRDGSHLVPRAKNGRPRKRRNNYLEEQFRKPWERGGCDTRTRHAPDRTRPPSCRRAVKIYMPHGHGCCIPRAFRYAYALRGDKIQIPPPFRTAVYPLRPARASQSYLLLNLP